MCVMPNLIPFCISILNSKYSLITPHAKVLIVRVNAPEQ